MTITTEQAIAHLAACTDAQASDTARACVHLAAELVRAREALEQVAAWDIRWAEGLDSNVERIKAIVDAALRAQPGEPAGRE